MKTIYKVSGLFTNGESNVLGTFKNIKEAREYYNSILKEDGYQPNPDETDYSIELNQYTYTDDIDYSDIETIESQSLYIEGNVDRLRNKEPEPLMYYYFAFWNAKEKQLEYTFYFHGEEEESSIFENDLDEWYFR